MAGAMMTTLSPNELITQYQTKYNRTLLPRARELVVLDQLALKSPFPKNEGAKDMRFHRKLIGSADNVNVLVEGVPPTDLREIKLEYVTATMVQYGEIVSMSDVSGLVELFSTLDESKDSLAEDAAYHADQVVRNMLCHASTGGTKGYVGGASTYAELLALTPAQGAATIKDLLREMTALKLARAPKISGGYLAVAPPQVSYDWMQDTEYWKPVNNYQSKEMAMKGEVGKWWGITILETTLPFIEDETEGVYDASDSATAGLIYSTIVSGKGGFGTPLMAGESPYDPQIMISRGPQKSDPLNQYTIAGFKTYWAALVLNKPWVRVLRSKTTYET